MAAPPPTIEEATRSFARFFGKSPALDSLGVRTQRTPAGKDRIRMTIVPFGKDDVLATLAAEAQVECWPLGAQVYTGDPDEDLEAALEQHAGSLKVNPYDNVIISTFLPSCAITECIPDRAPKLQALLDHVEEKYLPFEALSAWIAALR